MAIAFNTLHLLEYLAARLVERKYSVKAIIREIVLSEARQRSSTSHAANEKIDPGQCRTRGSRSEV